MMAAAPALAASRGPALLWRADEGPASPSRCAGLTLLEEQAAAAIVLPSEEEEEAGVAMAGGGVDVVF